MNLKAIVILIAVATAPILAGAIWMATRHAASKPKDPLGRKVTDMTSRQVRIPAKPAHVLSLCTSATDTIVALGARDCLTAIDEFSRVVPGTEEIPVVGKGSAISREQVTALGVDLAFVWWYQDDAAAMLEGLAIPVVRIRSGRAAELPALIRLIGQCLGRQEAAGNLALRLQTFLDQAATTRASSRKRVFIELYGPLKTVGRETFTNDLLELAGASNVAGDAKGTVLFSAERLVQADPDAILFVEGFSNRAALTARPGMAGLRAVREGQVLALNRYWLVAGPNLPQSVEEIRGVLARSLSP